VADGTPYADKGHHDDGRPDPARQVQKEQPMAQTEDVLAEYVERLFAKASLLNLAVLGHGRLLENGSLRPEGNRLDQLQSLATELEFGLGMLHDRLTERHELA
jgi:hypothetical protein